ncbi:MAG: PAS domain-containing protein [Pseudohongiella sp.]|nr:PAS domain-containing protein [Pseudohongiella sp.]
MSDKNKNRSSADDALHSAYLHLMVAGRAAKMGGWYLDIVDRKVHWSAETAAIHGLPESFSPELKDAINYYAPEYREQIAAAVERCVQEGVSFDETLELLHADGHRVWVRAIGEAVKDGNGTVNRIHGAFQDISELMAAREESRALSERLMHTLENISDAFLVIDKNWCFGYLNSQAEKLLQKKREELLGKHIWTEYPAAVGTRFQEQYELAINEQLTVSFIEYYPPPLDHWFEVNAYPTPDGLAVYFRDVNERFRQEEALRVSEERFRLIALATNDVIWDWDLVKDTVWWNDSLLPVFGHDPENIEAGLESWTNRVHPSDLKAATDSVNAVMKSKSTNSWQHEYRFMHANGEPRVVIDRGYVMRNAKGKPIRMLGSIMDMTDSREMNDRLRQSQKMEAVGQLTGGVAHDFNNLLTVILGNAELLTEQLTDQQQLRMLAEMTATAAERGAELTNRLLAFARRQPLEPKQVNLNKLIQGMDNLLRRTLQENIDIETVYAGGLWLSEVDPGQLEGALLNLAINARDAMPDGGKLTIETANTLLDESYACHHDEVRPGQYVLISVSDTGAGMPTTVVSRAFEPFFTTKQMGKGSGLGLSMVYGFAKQSGGHIKIYSEVNEGTTVKLYLPRAVNSADPLYEGHLAPKTEGGSEKILIVEDDTLVRQHVSAQLKTLGYRVISCSNAEDALDVIMQLSDIDLLFTDIVMPGSMNGRQLAEATHKLRPAIKILFTSGYTENAIVHHGRLDRGVHLLNKPYRRQELAAKVRKVLDETG